MKKRTRRRCPSCQELFYAHPRTRTVQKYCSKPQCRQASKKASQQRWLQKPENRDYFHGRQRVDRVQAWREAHPEYGQKGSRSGRLLQETIMGQRVDRRGKSAALALQETIEPQASERVAESAPRIAGALQDSI